MYIFSTCFFGQFSMFFFIDHPFFFLFVLCAALVRYLIIRSLHLSSILQPIHPSHTSSIVHPFSAHSSPPLILYINHLSVHLYRPSVHPSTCSIFKQIQLFINSSLIPGFHHFYIPFIHVCIWYVGLLHPSTFCQFFSPFVLSTCLFSISVVMPSFLMSIQPAHINSEGDVKQLNI